MQVVKFGGSSISNAQNIENVLEILKNYNNQTIVVFSAFDGITDLLIEARKLASKQDKNYLYKYSFDKSVCSNIENDLKALDKRIDQIWESR